MTFTKKKTTTTKMKVEGNQQSNLNMKVKVFDSQIVKFLLTFNIRYNATNNGDEGGGKGDNKVKALILWVRILKAT